MMKSFLHKGLKNFSSTGDTAKIPAVQAPRIRRRLDALDVAKRPEDLNLPGFNFHSLRGKPQRYAISVNGPWRIIFGWDGDNATQIDLENYH